MLINLFSSLYGPEVIAAFSGAMLFTLVQRTFLGLSRMMVFIVSFFMGVIGADTTVSLIRPYFPGDAPPGKEVGAFICSALIVNVAMLLIGRVEKYINTGHQP